MPVTTPSRRGPSKRGQYDYQKTFRPWELAQLCQVNPRTTGHWARHGLLDGLVTLGGHRRYRRADLDFLPVTGDPQLLTTPQFARLVNVHPATVWRWEREGRIERIRLPSGRPRIRRSDADAILTGLR